MSQSIDTLLAERGKRYGNFADHASVTQKIKAALQAGCSWRHLSPAQREALEMVAHKLGRIVNGDPDYKDSWTDIIGYTRLVEETLPEEAGDGAGGQP